MSEHNGVANDSDDLAASEGLLNGILFSVPLWAVMISALLRWHLW